jgi:hypothetical protein
MAKQLAFQFDDDFQKDWIATLSEAEKESITLVLKKMTIDYLTKNQMERKDG